jgi:hypothetical protein
MRKGNLMRPKFLGRFYYLTLTLLLASSLLVGQEPFNIPMVDQPKISVVDYTKSFYGQTVEKDASQLENGVSTFSHATLGIFANSQDVSNSLATNVSLSVIQYRLGIYSYTKEGTTDTVRIYLPFVILSKYDSARITSLDDLTSFGGSPLTFRLMPSYSWTVGLDNTFTVGHVSDVRAFVYRDSANGDFHTDFSYYGSLGVKYTGRGEVRDESGQSYQGNWSLSLLAYATSLNNKIRDLMVKDPGKASVGLEGLFKFLASESKLTRFNIYASVKYDMNANPNGSPWSFKFTIGS